MLKPTHPAAVLRAAQQTVGPAAVRSAAHAAIIDLETGMSAKLLADHKAGRASECAFSATVIALCARCNEIRLEAGLPLTGAEVCAPADEVEPEWQVAYALELERYRDLAGRNLVCIFARSK